MQIQVHKFGGAVLGKLKGFESLNYLINSDKTPKVIIISALNNTTRLLKSISYSAEKGDTVLSVKLLDGLIKSHIDYSQTLDITDFDDFIVEINAIHENLFKLINGISLTNQLTPRTLDLMMSFGEKLALLIVKYKFQNLNNVVFIDSTNLIRTDSNYGKANPIIEVSSEMIIHQLSEFLKQGKIIITQGFVAKDDKDEITTMGFESSNLTATLIADSLKCYELVIWTDVDGIRNADPALFNPTSLIPELNYNQAEIASFSGLKLIYPTMIEIAMKKSMTIKLRNGLTASKEMTVINGEKSNEKPILIVEDNVILTEFSKQHFDENELISNDLVAFKLTANEIRIYKKSNNMILADNQMLVAIITLCQLPPNLKSGVLGILLKFNESMEILDFNKELLRFTITNGNKNEIINLIFEMLG